MESTIKRIGKRRLSKVWSTTCDDGTVVTGDTEKACRIAQIERNLRYIDVKSIRAARAFALGAGTQKDTETLSRLEAQATALRTELDTLKV